MRVWRNWQTRKIQVLMIARLCRFKSCHPHQSKKQPLRLLFCFGLFVGAEPVRASGAGGRPSEARKCRIAAPVTTVVGFLNPQRKRKSSPFGVAFCIFKVRAAGLEYERW